MKISVIGTGYVGLVSGVCLASKGHQVTCVDLDPAKVERINRADPPIHEAGLAELLAEHIGKGLVATTDLHAAVAGSELSLIAVGTPFNGDQIDLTYIREASRQIGEAIGRKDGFHVVVVKSTVVPGTTEDVVLPILEASSGKKAGTDFGVGMNPEFLREGEAIGDFMNPDRIVLGGIDERTIAKLDEVYAAFSETDKIRTSPRTAEMIKYTANSLLATLISFSNEIGNLCATLQDVDVVEVMHGVHLDKRFSPILASGERVRPGLLTYLAAGCGFGGSCFPKDVKALISFGRENRQPMPILGSVVETNRNQPARMLELVRRRHPDLKGIRVAVLGLAFKPGTDDIRESPSISVIRELVEQGAIVTAFDPVVRGPLNSERLETVIHAETMEDCVCKAEVILLMTSWPKFSELPELIRRGEAAPLVVDGRRLIPKDGVDAYAAIGLGRKAD